MRNFLAVCKKELRVYFATPLLYILAGVFLALSGYYLYSDLVWFVTFGFGVNILENFWQLLLIDMHRGLIFVVPLLTMRLFAEEKRLGTIELLFTYPLRDGELVAGKLAACLLAVTVLLAPTALYPLLLYRIQPFCVAPLVAGYLGLFLLGATFASYGIFVSSLTDRQVVAGALTMIPLLLLWVLSWNEAAANPGQLSVLRAISMFDHFQTFAVGVIDARDVFYFLAVCGLFVFLTLRVLEARQWRGKR